MTPQTPRSMLVQAVAWLCACLVFPASAWAAQLSARFTPSRTSGAAPLAVFLDASASTCSGCAGIDNPWHDLAYAWDFGDPQAGTWSTNGLSKAKDIGPSAAHVFEAPGQYVVQLTVVDPGTGKSSVTSHTITVTDPDPMGGRTFCYAATGAGSFSGCPAGATQRTMSSFSAAIADCKGTGHRCLFRRGDTFRTSTSVRLDGSAPEIIGAFGSGAKPLIDASGLGGGTLFMGTAGGRDYRVMDLLLKGPAERFSRIYGVDHVQSDVLFLRVDGVPSTWHIFMETSPSQLAQAGFLQHMFAVECQMKKVGFGGGGNILYLSWEASAVLGNDLEDTRTGEHIIRAAQYDNLLIAHNVLGGANTGKHVITLRSADAAAPCTVACAPSKKGHIHANIIYESDPYAVQVCGHVQSQTQQCEDTLVEGNFASLSPLYPLRAEQTVMFHLADQTTTRTTFRNNICDLSNAAGACVNIKVSSLARAVNNTCYRNDGRALTCINVLGGGPGSASTIARNNLAFSTGGAVTLISGSFKTSDHNVHATSNPFVKATPGATPSDYQLAAVSQAVNAGTAVPNLFDFGERVRPTRGAHDVGAWQRGAGSFSLAAGSSAGGSAGGDAADEGVGVAGEREVVADPLERMTDEREGIADEREAIAGERGDALGAVGGEAADSTADATAELGARGSPSSDTTGVSGEVGCSAASGNAAGLAALLLGVWRRRRAVVSSVPPSRHLAGVLWLAACAGAAQGTLSGPGDEPGGSSGGAAAGGGSSPLGGGSVNGDDGPVGGGTPGGGSGGATASGGGSQSVGGGSPSTLPQLTSDEQAILAARPYHLVVPATYDGSSPVPFMLLLHGYANSGSGVDSYFGMSAVAQARGFLLATPDGEPDLFGLRYWNATDYCCGTTLTPKPDDVAYLTAIMDDVRLKYRVDEKRVFAVGHSNGGFMSHRLACDRSDRIAAIVSLAGAQWRDLSNCNPAADVSVLEVHGDADPVVQYDGTDQYPGAPQTTRDWATLDQCADSTGSAGADVDLTPDCAGAETSRVRYDGCPMGRDVELWTIHGGSHMPAFNSTSAGMLCDFLMAHPKP